MMDKLPNGIVSWYPVKPNSDILFLFNEENENIDVLGFLRFAEVSQCDKVRMKEFDLLLESSKTYDDIVCLFHEDGCGDYAEFFDRIQSLLKPTGRLLFTFHNRFAIRNFCGDRDFYTDRSFDGIENYRNAVGMGKGRCYARFEMEKLLEQAGFTHRKFYSVFPSVELPQLIYAEGYLPNEELGIRYFPRYHYPDSVFLQEEYLLNDLARNGMFHQMANGYLVECSMDGTFADTEHVTLSMDRGKAKALATMIHSNHTVEKKALFEEGIAGLKMLESNRTDLCRHGVCVLDGAFKGESYVMPYVEAETALAYLRRLFFEDRDLFIQEMDRFCDIIKHSSESYIADESVGAVRESVGAKLKSFIEGEVYLNRGYMDLVPLNCFYMDGTFVFYDQEFYEENYPLKAILIRVVDIVYMADPGMEAELPSTFFFERYGLSKHLNFWREKAGEFTRELRHQKELAAFDEKYSVNVQTLNTNRLRVNYSEEEYNEMFVHLFENTQGKKLILFGSGYFMRKFMAQFGKEHSGAAAIDNNQSKWGEKVDGVEIVSPDYLKDFKPEEYKVIICIKHYYAVLQQLKKLGAKNFGIYNPYVAYPAEPLAKVCDFQQADTVQQAEQKKYHVGYIAGVFDLFHVGHLNLLKRAKEQCDFLIVGVVSEEAVIKNKKVAPFIPFDERLELVQSCRYVDKAVEIPYAAAGTRDMYRKYHFDVQFSGSDYEHDGYWLGEREYLRKHGSDLVFFPYTQGTSSTKIKGLIEERLRK